VISELTRAISERFRDVFTVHNKTIYKSILYFTFLELELLGFNTLVHSKFCEFIESVLVRHFVQSNLWSVYRHLK